MSPGPIEATDILQKVGMPKEASDQVYVQMAKAVAFLALDATYTTGTEIPVDGGWTQL